MNNCETWVEIAPRTINSLDNLQNMFYRYLLATPRSCPIPALLWETGGLIMEHRIAKKKLIFYNHLVNLPVDTQSYEVANLQATLSYPSLIS